MIDIKRTYKIYKAPENTDEIKDRLVPVVVPADVEFISEEEAAEYLKILDYVGKSFIIMPSFEVINIHFH